MGKKYIDPLSDGGFKIFFGKVGKSEGFLIDFLNGLFVDDPDLGGITSVKYLNNEVAPDRIDDKQIRYDIQCTTSTGHKYVVEMQRQTRPHFEKRAAYYIAKAMADQASDKVGDQEWRYKDLQPVVGVFVLEDHLPGKKKKPVLDYKYREKEDHNDTLNLSRQVFIQLEYFDRLEEECVNRKDQWLFILKNLESMEYMPFSQTKDQIFKRLDHYAQIANLSNPERVEYDRLLKFSRDYYSDMDDYIEEGRAEGRAEAKSEVALKMKAMGMDKDTISNLTGLTSEEIERL